MAPGPRPAARLHSQLARRVHTLLRQAEGGSLDRPGASQQATLQTIARDLVRLSNKRSQSAFDNVTVMCIAL